MARSIGLPGVQMDNSVSPELGAMLMTEPEGKQRIGVEDIRKAGEILRKYKDGKANLESRVIEDELWWELRHWEAVGRNKDSRAGKVAQNMPKSTSGWLFSAITNKHADAMDNYPEPVALPREASDEGSAKVLTNVLPVVLEQNDFEQTYSDNWWEKLKHGTSVYGIFWDQGKENGLGDINICQIDLLHLFWEPGVTDIQKSKNLFIVELVDEDDLNRQYPEYNGKLGGKTIDVAKYLYDDNVDTSGKSVAVDWYYKVRTVSGQTALHYVKFVGDTILYASENDPDRRDTGWYEHGLYPVVFDVLYPEKGTPVGYGLVSVCKDPQLYIDDLSSRVLKSAMMQTTPRWFASDSLPVNRQQLLDWSEPLVEVTGSVSDERLRPFTVDRLDGNVLNVLQMKIEEMKETANNRDVNNGGGSAVTAAAAVAALQEAGNKGSRDMIGGSYRADVKIVQQVVELMRQFYDETRTFRIVGEAGAYEFVDLNNAQLKDQLVGVSASGVEMFRRPIFDIKIKAQKKNPFSRAEQNERAKELYAAGVFNPERAQEALLALEMMDFEGIDKVREQVKQGQTLLNMVQQMSAQMEQMAAMLGMQMGGMPSAPAPSAGGQPHAIDVDKGMTNSMAQAQRPRTAYMDALAKRSKPDMTMMSDAAMPM